MASNVNQHNQLLQLFAAYAKRLDKLYDDFVNKLIASLPYSEDEVWEQLAVVPLFRFDQLPYMSARLQHIFDDYVNKQVLCYKAGITDGVALAFSQDKINLGKYTILQDEAIKAARNAAVASFIANRMSRKEGLSLSDKVWNYSQLGKSEVEMGISNVLKDGLKAGTSAEELGRKVRQYLNNPTMMYRRYWVTVADNAGNKKKVARWYRRHIDPKTGKVTFSDEPLEKVGMGVYRSARMNGYRLMRTEINMSYHKANASRWANEPFVYGIKIWLSPQHPEPDICDGLAGEYPKDFDFSGWHPQCYADGTKVLTDKGWKLLQDVSFNDEICSLNPITKAIEYVGIIDKQASERRGFLYRFRGHGVDCMVTPEHRMVFLDKNNTIRYSSAKSAKRRKGAFMLSLMGNKMQCRKFSISKIPYQGMVYDLTLKKNHIMYVRHNDTCFWGSNCMCASTPMTLWGDEKKDFYRRLMKGEDMSNFHSKYEITKENMNPNWKRYIETNHDAIKNAASRGKLAYFLRDNKQFWINSFTKAEQREMGMLKSIKEIADARHAARTEEQAKDIADRWHAHKHVDALIRKGSSMLSELKEYPSIANYKMLQTAIEERDAHSIELFLSNKDIAKKLEYEKKITPKELLWSNVTKILPEKQANAIANMLSSVVKNAETSKTSSDAVTYMRNAMSPIRDILSDEKQKVLDLILDREDTRIKDYYSFNNSKDKINAGLKYLKDNINSIGGTATVPKVDLTNYYLGDTLKMQSLAGEISSMVTKVKAVVDNAAFVAQTKSPIVKKYYEGIRYSLQKNGLYADVNEYIAKLEQNIERLKKEGAKKVTSKAAEEAIKKAASKEATIEDIEKGIDASISSIKKTSDKASYYDYVIASIKDNLTYRKNELSNALKVREDLLRMAVKEDVSGNLLNMYVQRFKHGVAVEEFYDRQVWQGFSDAQIKNMKAIEGKIGIRKGRPMSVEEADRHNSNRHIVEKYIIDEKGDRTLYIDGKSIRAFINPNFKSKDLDYHINCATCSPTYVLREKGFNITAKARHETSLNNQIANSKSFDVWKNADGTKAKPTLLSDWARDKGYKQMTQKRYREFYEESTKTPGTYVVTLAWSKNSGHATILKRLASGKLVYIEPQHYYGSKIGAMRPIDELCRAYTKIVSGKGIMRVDDKLFDTDWCSIFGK